MDCFLNIFSHVLPGDLSLRQLQELAPATLWRENPRQAALEALANCPRINWEAYLARYPDVRAANIDPCRHFIEHGIHENRRLTSWHPLKQTPNAAAPLVSIIIPNFNNVIYLPKCIESATNQTLRNIEIILVDDGSTDDSLAIMRVFAAKDARIKIIEHKDNASLFMARKHGVMAASGNYVLFVDSDDFLALDACEIAYNEISKGYDIVSFSMQIVGHDLTSKSDLSKIENNFNKGTNRVYDHNELIQAMFIDSSLFCNVDCKLFLREIIQVAYAELKDGYFNMLEDRYAMTAIARIARNYSKISNKLYYYSYGTGVSTAFNNQFNIKQWFNACDTIQANGDYINEHCLSIDFAQINFHHCRLAVNKWINDVENGDARELFERMIAGFGFEAVISSLIEINRIPDLRLVRKMAHCITLCHKDSRRPKHIGLFYHRISMGGIQRIIACIAQALLDNGFKVTIFIEEQNRAEMKLPPAATIAHIDPAGVYKCTTKAHILSFWHALQAKGIDLLIHAGGATPALFWDIVLANYLRIPVIINYHGNFAWSYAERATPYKAETREAVYACAPAVTVLSRATELYMRLRGINAIYIHNPVYPRNPAAKQETPGPCIAVIGRLGDPIKQARQAVMVFKEVRRFLPTARLVLIGDFNIKKQRDEFEKYIADASLAAHINITGWTDNPDAFLNECDILLSTSYWEAFPLGIAEAQALGKPCVIYDLPIEQAQDNPSIIRVPQGDYRAAAAAIVSLYGDKNKMAELARLAVEKVKQYSPQSFCEAIIRLINNFPDYSPWRPYAPDIYETIINYGAFYNSREIPAKV